MDPKMQRIIALVKSKKKPESSLPWIRQEPHPQPYHIFNSLTDSWQETTPSASSSSTAPVVDKFTLMSWNIDFMLPFNSERLTVALTHLHTLVAPSQSGPTIIFLQEMLVSDLRLIQSQPWIREFYNLTDLDSTHWESGHYGTCTLIPKSLPIISVFRVHYDATRMERDGLFVDVAVSPTKALRLCNTHLESLAIDPPRRPAQLATASTHMFAANVHASVLAGDLNAIQPFDRTLHNENGLQDAYLALGGEEDKDEGFTWGQMAAVRQREMFGCSRMDKVLFCGGVEVVGFETFGLGVEVQDTEVRSRLIEENGLDGGWVTDHLGVKGEFKVVDRVGDDIAKGWSAKI